MLEYAELKKVILIGQTVFGAFLLYIARKLINETAANEITYHIAGFVMTITGIGCLCFGIITFALRDDPDVWR